MFLATMFVLSIVFAQLVRIQAFDSGGLAVAALKEREGTTALLAPRGEILDGNGVVLASTLERVTVSVNQRAVCVYLTKDQTCDPSRSAGAVLAAAQALSPLLDKKVQDLVPELTGAATYRIIAKDVSPLTWRKINDLKIPGIYHEVTTERTYPQSTTAASLVGFVSADPKNNGGIEKQYNSVLSGTDGKQVYEKAADGQTIPDSTIVQSEPVAGRDVQLSIDSDLQWYAQNVLAQQVNKVQAVSGTVVVQDVKTGRLLAVASYPTFDPNNLGAAKGSLANLAFSDVFEPGSTGKVITMAAAMQEGKVTPQTQIVIPSGMHRYDTDFRDAESHPEIWRTVAGALAESSNMGTMLVGETISAATQAAYMHKFGLGEMSGTGFPGESKGLLDPVNEWSGTKRYTVMYGQGVSITAVQAAQVYQTIANGGVRVAPSLVKAVGNADGTLTEQPVPKGQRVVSASVAHQLSEMLEGVVSDEGTAPAAQIPGYRVAGKTGTANRPTATGYSGYTSSFIGYAPADKPEVVVAVIVQRPIKGTAGGVIAAPVFHDVMAYALQHLGVPPTGTSRPDLTLELDHKPDLSDPKVLRDRGLPSTR